METTAQSKVYTSLNYPVPPPTWVSSSGGIDDNEYDSTFSPGVAFFLGNEVSGVDTELLPILDQVIEIPMFGKESSLNVASCAPIAMYAILRQWGIG
jgi:tRNA G18 (ribose-2'-O)-methylase SpoU